ncbi:MAG: SAM-dependent methyltransferase [Clostridia bacterium]|nr:SAM-dependent methyltransferase [Clostridia bacterium]
MTDRLTEIFNSLPSCKVFADVGCDHGYISLEMLKSNKAEKVIFSDISKNCLEKARELLKEYEKDGRAEGYVSNGFDNLPPFDLALIAGMGGEEIISIIEKAKDLPQKLVVQPMKNSPKVREVLLKKGYKIIKDYTFKAENKFYDLITLEKGNDFLTEEEKEFGRTNLALRPTAFLEKLSVRKKALRSYIENENIGESAREELVEELKRIEKIC